MQNEKRQNHVSAAGQFVSSRSLLSFLSPFFYAASSKPFPRRRLRAEIRKLNIEPRERMFFQNSALSRESG
jgi:hypothetical protein